MTTITAQLSISMIMTGLPAMTRFVLPIILWVTGFLCLLNIVLAIIFRKNGPLEVISYYAVCLVELAIFVLALLVSIGVISRSPFYLPPSLPVDQAEIAAVRKRLGSGRGGSVGHRVHGTELIG